ncbi:hypothetical protein HPB51_029451 [Rhipicephalus microplus]|uniref:Uncharacterized protein n=1 Tax=Rhipicephalus microplus TaxID=6941 RepID=A0A9J6CUV5_RHIMP|nr:hypothetical protein HPB51_029451 [Rhipicephalus microplus]
MGHSGRRKSEIKASGSDAWSDRFSRRGIPFARLVVDGRVVGRRRSLHVYTRTGGSALARASLGVGSVVVSSPQPRRRDLNRKPARPPSLAVSQLAAGDPFARLAATPERPTNALDGARSSVELLAAGSANDDIQAEPLVVTRLPRASDTPSAQTPTRRRARREKNVGMARMRRREAREFTAHGMQMRNGNSYPSLFAPSVTRVIVGAWLEHVQIRWTVGSPSLDLCP